MKENIVEQGRGMYEKEMDEKIKEQEKEMEEKMEEQEREME